MNMHFNVKKIIVDPGVSLIPLPKSTKYELTDIKRAWIDCEIEINGSIFPVKLIIDGVVRGNFLTITAKECPIKTVEIMQHLFRELASFLHATPLTPVTSKMADDCTICLMLVDEDAILGALHKIKETKGFTIKSKDV